MLQPRRQISIPVPGGGPWGSGDSPKAFNVALVEASGRVALHYISTGRSTPSLPVVLRGGTVILIEKGAVIGSATNYPYIGGWK